MRQINNLLKKLKTEKNKEKKLAILEKLDAWKKTFTLVN